MKKVTLMAAIAGFLIISCNNSNTKEVEVKDTTIHVDAKEDTVKSLVGNAAGEVAIPKFSSAETQKLAEDYTKYIKEFITVAKSGDVVKLKELASKRQEWATKETEAVSKFTPEDAKLWKAYAESLGRELTASLTK
ncbi:hypothetical protein [Sphingobacterium sp. UBA5670]|uniref:hypothetical protein n=1 Tax=Sphingobacterium sp. UBA5670 TaxID=1947502 RepID=UPI0025CE35AC|nr:hypothetical protein [Sphingobacterium sp. UBA5670]